MAALPHTSQVFMLLERWAARHLCPNLIDLAIRVMQKARVN